MKNIYKLTIIITLLVILSSCSKEWLDVNSDPNTSQFATVDLVFPSAVGSSASVIGGQYALLGGILSQYFTQSNGANQYKEIDEYNLVSSFDRNQFEELYSGALTDYKYVIDQATKDQNWSYVLMGTVMQAYTFQVLADLYDQIPYNEALMGSANYTPHYDGGQLVYDSLIARINRAEMLDFTVSTSRNPGTADFIFGGDITKWLQFANTLKLKMYLREVYANQSVAQSGINAMVTDPNFAGFLNTDAAMTQFIDQQTKDNPMYEDNIKALNYSQNLRLSKTFYSWLSANDDTMRLAALFTQPYVALDQGDFTNSTNPNNFSVFIQSPTDAVYFMSTAESYFLQAEAAIWGFTSGDAKTLYNSGVEASFNQLGLTTAYADNYLKSGGSFEFKDTTFEAKQEMIIVQKWASFAGTRQGLEGFFECNRTQYPKISGVYSSDGSYISGQLVIPAHAAIPTFPKRLLFVDFEQQRNPNTPKQVPITTNVWWDKK